MQTKELSATAVTLYDIIGHLDCFEKRDIVAILTTFVELDVRRYMQAQPPKKAKP
jgi:hypothetical protein